MTDDDLAVKEETTEAGQISELKEELQKQQEQINALNLRPNKGMMTWERVLLYFVFVFTVLTLPQNGIVLMALVLLVVALEVVLNFSGMALNVELWKAKRNTHGINSIPTILYQIGSGSRRPATDIIMK